MVKILYIYLQQQNNCFLFGILFSEYNKVTFFLLFREFLYIVFREEEKKKKTKQIKHMFCIQKITMENNKKSLSKSFLFQYKNEWKIQSNSVPVG